MLAVLVTETTFAVASKSQKGSFEGEEERVLAKGHSNEWGEINEGEMVPSGKGMKSVIKEASTQNSKNEIRPKAYPDDLHLFRISF